MAASGGAGTLAAMFAHAPRMRLTTWCAVWGYVLLASGLPLPFGAVQPVGGGAASEAAGKRLAAKDRSRPFPCMDKPCGCATAEQCFSSCCCHTPAERLAWAKAHRVEPAVPAALERRVAAEVARATPAGGCCAAKATKRPACCSDRGGPPRKTAHEPDVCGEYQSLATEPTGDDFEPTALPVSPAEPTRAPLRIRTVTLQAMLACGGIVTHWLAVGGSLPPPRVELALQAPFVAVCTCGDHAADSISAAPALPPPRAA
jgi:hypothetical protein